MQHTAVNPEAKLLPLTRAFEARGCVAVVYSVIDAEWPSVRLGLRERLCGMGG